MKQQIKVTDTRMHIYKGSPNVDFQVTVAEAKLVLVPAINTDSIILFKNINGKYHQSITLNQPWSMWKPILISETEKIEDDDWVFGKQGTIMQHCPKLWRASGDWKKILALPEHFSPKHLQAIVDGKLKDGDKVLVECENFRINNHEYPYKSNKEFIDNYFIKLNSSNHITLHRVEEKMYTREEVFKLLLTYTSDLPYFDTLYNGHREYNCKKWFEQNVK